MPRRGDRVRIVAALVPKPNLLAATAPNVRDRELVELRNERLGVRLEPALQTSQAAHRRSSRGKAVRSRHQIVASMKRLATPDVRPNSQLGGKITKPLESCSSTRPAVSEIFCQMVTSPGLPAKVSIPIFPTDDVKPPAPDVMRSRPSRGCPMPLASITSSAT